jgi:D-cysteine desulfhydrase
MGCAIGSLDTEIVAVRASNPSTASLATLASIVAETTRFARALDPTFPPLTGSSIKLRIDGRFVGRGYGAPSREGNDAVALANRAAGWQLDPVYTGKALAALIADAKVAPDGPWLFWNTQSSRPLARAPVPEAFRAFVPDESD